MQTETRGDFELIHRARTGDGGAFMELVRRHDRSVFAVASRFVTSADDAKDIYQEVMIRVFRGLRTFRQEAEFATWLHRITVNVCLQHRERRKNREAVSLDGDGSVPAGNEAEDTATHASPEQSAIASDLDGHIRRALERLSPRQRMVFVLRHYEDRTVRDIATTLTCREGTVKRYLFEATQIMREQLKDLMRE